MESVKKGFVLIPDRRIMVESMKLSEQLKENKLSLSLDWHLPHVTLLQTYFKGSFDFKSALKEIRNHWSFNHEPSTKLARVAVTHFSGRNQITWWNIENSHWLKELNRELIETYEDQIIKPELKPALTFSNEAAKNSYLRTGYSRNLEAYEPHITLGVSTESQESLVTPLAGERVRFHRLAFVTHDEFGQIDKILSEVELPISWD